MNIKKVIESIYRYIRLTAIGLPFVINSCTYLNRYNHEDYANTRVYLNIDNYYQRNNKNKYLDIHGEVYLYGSISTHKNKLHEGKAQYTISLGW